jgi:hypothetical protein
MNGHIPTLSDDRLWYPLATDRIVDMVGMPSPLDKYFASLKEMHLPELSGPAPAPQTNGTSHEDSEARRMGRELSVQSLKAGGYKGLKTLIQERVTHASYTPVYSIASRPLDVEHAQSRRATLCGLRESLSIFNKNFMVSGKSAHYHYDTLREANTDLRKLLGSIEQEIAYLNRYLEDQGVPINLARRLRRVERSRGRY